MSYTPRALIVGYNSLVFKATFTNSKNAVISYGRTFPIKPNVILTPSDTSVAPAYKTSESTSGCTIKMPTPWTGIISVSVQETNANI